MKRILLAFLLAAGTVTSAFALEESARLAAVSVTEKAYGDSRLYLLGEANGKAIIPHSLDFHDDTLWVGSSAGLLMREPRGVRWRAVLGEGFDGVDEVVAGPGGVAINSYIEGEHYNRSGSEMIFEPAEGRWRKLPFRFSSGTWQGRTFWFGREGEFGFYEPDGERMHVYDSERLPFLTGKPIYEMELRGDFLWMAMGPAGEGKNTRFPGGAMARYNTDTGQFRPLHRYHGAIHDQAMSLALGVSRVWAGHWSHDPEWQLEGITEHDPDSGEWMLHPFMPDGGYPRAEQVVASGDYIWFVDDEHGLARLHPDSGKVQVHSINAALPWTIADMVSDGQGIWLAAYEHDRKGREMNGIIAYVPDPPAWQTLLLYERAQVLKVSGLALAAALLVLLIALRFGVSRGLAGLLAMLVFAALPAGAWWYYQQGKDAGRPASSSTISPDPASAVILPPNPVISKHVRESMAMPDETSFRVLEVRVREEDKQVLKLEVDYQSELDPAKKYFIGGDALIGKRRLRMSYNPDAAPPGRGTADVKIIRPDRLSERFCSDHVLVTVYSPSGNVDVEAFDYAKAWENPDQETFEFMENAISGCKVSGE